ncbi:acyl-homoserine-lactone synthase [Paraburkholderia phosphatilytica]|uniref:acyl-homoserine-lactone synthase n=1 Tax=Paraburkholderia phosphatilytica TaxID=2282883 RepID=UPI0013DFB7E4|nr:acyl-homoserine-lactone synthase [Paraburkholderia phosphatilytica]
MTVIVAGTVNDLPSAITSRLGAYRYQVFVERLGWRLPLADRTGAVEWDQFDSTVAIQLAALDASGQVCGCARLMPTTGRHLLREVFADLAAPGASPVSPRTWELSRLAATPSRGCTGAKESGGGISLFASALALARSFGANRIVGVLTPAVARLYRRAGLELEPLQPDAPACAPVQACAVNIVPATFARLHCDPEELLGSVHWFGPWPPACAAPVTQSLGGAT